MIELDPIKYSVRSAQLLRYGAGSLVDFPDQTLMTTKPELWQNPIKIFDDRFANHLGVDYFIQPGKVTYCRFPNWYFCPRCNSIRKLEDWIYDYKKANPQKDDNMIKHMVCTNNQCKGMPLVAAGVIVACEAGHIDDFPWVEWVHLRSKKKPCLHPDLKIYTTGADSLDGVRVACRNCGADATLQGSFGQDAFMKMHEMTNDNAFRCSGYHPHRKSHEPCPLYPRALRRGASSVYYPTVITSLVIPPYSDKIRSKVENSRMFDSIMTLLDSGIDTNSDTITPLMKMISTENNIEYDDVKRIFEEKVSLKNRSSEDDSSYRFAEYEVLNGSFKTTSSSDDFVIKNLDAKQYGIPQIKTISLVHKVRVISASVGFSRVKPVSDDTSRNFVSTKDKNTKYFPGYETRGEGIFIELDMDKVEEWMRNTPEIISRAKILTDNYHKSFNGHNKKDSISPKYILLHTLSHLLISQLSFECGYNVSSLNERIYFSDKPGEQMLGIFIYTASGDSEGTLGGLIRQGEPDILPKIFKRAITSAFQCSNDPVCALSKGQGREALNLSACYSCCLLPETSCEIGNVYLDRTMVIGTLFNEKIGFFYGIDKMTIEEHEIDTVEITDDWGKKPDKPNSSTAKKKTARYLVGEDFKSYFDSWEDFSNVIDNIDCNKIKDVPLPLKYDGKFIIDNSYGIPILLEWPNKKILLDATELTSAEKTAIEDLGYTIYLRDGDINNIIGEIK